MLSLAVTAILAITPFVPTPHYMTAGKDPVFIVSDDTPVIVSDSATTQQISQIESAFEVIGLSPAVIRASGYEAGEKAIHISVAGQMASNSQRNLKSRLNAMDPPPASGYRLIVERQGIMLVGADDEGLRYGLTTLRQLLLQTRDLPVVRIRDYPDTSLRGVYLPRPINDSGLAQYGAAKLSRAFFDAVTSVDAQSVRRAGMEPVPVFAMDATLENSLASYPESSLQALGLRPSPEAYDYLGEDNAPRFAEEVNSALRKVGREYPGVVAIYLWADLLNPFQDGLTRNTAAAISAIPKNVVLMVSAAPHEIDAALSWLEEVDHRAVILPTGDDDARMRLAAYEALEEGANVHGVVVAADSTEALGLVAQKGWSRESPTLPWPAVLNDFFGSHAWTPNDDQVLEAMIGRLNRRTLAGIMPEHELKAWKTFVRDTRKTPVAPVVKTMDRAYENLIEYVALEAAFTKKQSQEILEALVLLVDEHARLDSTWDRQRAATIMEVIQKKKLFVPSTILFGHHVAPYRSMELPPNSVVLELPAEPVIDEELHIIKGWYDLQQSMAPVVRLDFETVATLTFLLEQSDDDRNYRTVLHASSQQRGGLRPPVMLETPAASPYFTFVLNAPAEKAQFRNPRLYALKHRSPEVVAQTFTGTIAIDGRLDEPEWQISPQVNGFVSPDGDAFARAGTTVRILRDNVGLYLAAEMADGPAQTVVVTAGSAQTPSTERLRIFLQHRAQDLFEMEVGRDGNARHNLKFGDWDTAVRDTPRGWIAEMHIPYTSLTDQTRMSLNWSLNMLRLGGRVDGDTQWSVTADPGEDPFPMGRLAL